MTAATTIAAEQARARRLRRERVPAHRAARHPARLDGLHRLPDLLDGLDVVQGRRRVGDLAAALAAARSRPCTTTRRSSPSAHWTRRSAGRRPSRPSPSGRASATPCWCARSASLLALLLGTFLAYAISRFNVGGKYFRHTILTIRMIPPIVVAISILIYYAILIPYATTALFGMRISLFDTYVGLILIYTVTTLPFVIWMMLTFIDEVPYTLEHAARLMGAGRIEVIRRVVLPLVASGMVVTFLFVFILNWAEFLLALTLTHPEVTTLDGAAQQIPERVGGPPLRPAGRHRHHDHDPGGDPRHPDPEAPGQGLQLRHHPASSYEERRCAGGAQEERGRDRTQGPGQDVRRLHRRERHQSRHPRRRVPDHGRPFRLRQDHDAQHDLGPRDADQRPRSSSATPWSTTWSRASAGSAWCSRILRSSRT